MTPIYNLSHNNCVLDWLHRVKDQYKEETPEKIKAADYDRARQSLGLERNITNNYSFFLPQPEYTGVNIGTSRTTNNIYNTYGLADSLNESALKKKKKTEKGKIDWKGIATIGIVSAAVAGTSTFVYARLSKAVEGARNYLENTKRIESWSNTILHPLDLETSRMAQQINEIAQVQKKIDKSAVDKITNYKYSILTSLVGTLVMASGGIAILASVPALATAGTAAVVAGGVLNLLVVIYAAYNCGIHWSDEEEGKREFAKISDQIPVLIEACNPAQSQTSEHSQHQENPPSYKASQAIYNQRANPNKAYYKGIYPDLAELIPSAPSYEEISKANC